MSGFDRTPSSQTARPLTRIAPPIQLPPVVSWPVPVALPSGPITSMEDCSSAPHHGLVFLDVVAERARLVHQEHGSIELARRLLCVAAARIRSQPLGRKWSGGSGLSRRMLKPCFSGCNRCRSGRPNRPMYESKAAMFHAACE